MSENNRSLPRSPVGHLQAVVNMEAAPPPCDDTLNIKVVEANDGIAKGKWIIDRAFINGLGVVMGGYLCSAADIMMAYAISSRLTEQQTFASIDLHTTFHRPAFEGEALVEARVERLGSKVAYVVADVFQNDKKIASCVSSMMVLPFKA